MNPLRLYRRTIVLALFLAAAGVLLYGAGLSTHFAEVLVENLQIGRTYNTSDLIGLPLRVRNASEKSVELRMETIQPNTDPVRKEYEPIPDKSWVRIEKSSHTVAPGEEAVSNVFITIPLDKNLRGRRFIVHLHSYTVPPKEGGAAISVGLISKLLFTISKFEGPDSRQEAAKVFQVNPPDTFLPGVKVGEKLHSGEQFGKSLTLYNPNDFQCEYHIKSIPIDPTKSKIRVGFEETPNPAFLQPQEEVVRVPPHANTTVYFFVQVPDNTQYRGKNYMFLIETEQRTGSPNVKVYNRVYVFTE